MSRTLLIPSVGNVPRPSPVEKTGSVTVAGREYSVTVSRLRPGLPTTEKILVGGKLVRTAEEKKGLPAEVLKLQKDLEEEIARS